MVIDFLNVDYLKHNLIAEEVQTKDAIDFLINRSINKQFISKDIRFSIENKEYHFTEYVRNINLQTFKEYFYQAGLKLKYIFGDYNLNEFNTMNSPRLILVLE